MPYDPQKHHRRSIRLKGYDYSQAGAYFVTICAEHRACVFGEIVDGEMLNNAVGDIVVKWWNELPRYYLPVILDAFVLMPNHLHGILVISDGEGWEEREGREQGQGRGDPAPTRGDVANGRGDTVHDMGSAENGRGDPASTKGDVGIGRGDPAPTRRTFGQLIGYFKYQSSKEINQLRRTTSTRIFQRDYYEHIIRNDVEWSAIADYIKANPANWKSDFDNPTNFPKRLTPLTVTEYLRDAGL